ncbi:MAG: hypothetical protein HY666_04935 [Chloroflexi bacterium]|nr:hypothetical protein [Chloroflexota bacterium]
MGVAVKVGVVGIGTRVGATVAVGKGAVVAMGAFVGVAAIEVEIGVALGAGEPGGCTRPILPQAKTANRR